MGFCRSLALRSIFVILHKHAWQHSLRDESNVNTMFAEDPFLLRPEAASFENRLKTESCTGFAGGKSVKTISLTKKGEAFTVTYFISCMWYLIEFFWMISIHHHHHIIIIIIIIIIRGHFAPFCLARADYRWGS